MDNSGYTLDSALQTKQCATKNPALWRGQCNVCYTLLLVRAFLLTTPNAIRPGIISSMTDGSGTDSVETDHLAHVAAVEPSLKSLNVPI